MPLYLAPSGHTNTCMNTGGVSFLLCVYLGQTRRGGEEEQRAERRGLPVEERLLRRTALTIVKGDQTGEEKIQQTVANTSKKGTYWTLIMTICNTPSFCEV